MSPRSFTTREEIDAYLARDLIECLECGRHFKSLATHLPRVHGMTGREYKLRWGLPQSAQLMGRYLVEQQSARVRQMINDGHLTYEHLPRATQAAHGAERSPRALVDIEKQRAIAMTIPHETLPPGAKRADGRDADRAREYQRRYRSRRK